MTTWKDHARNLAVRLHREDILHDHGWFNAISNVPRHLFVPKELRPDDDLEWRPHDTINDLAGAYSTTTLVIKVNEAGLPIVTATKPDLIARMLESLQIDADDRVLEIGTGSGYQTALLTYRFGPHRIQSIDIDDSLAALAKLRLMSIGLNPTVRIGNGIHGLAEQAPYDKIIATGSTPRIPRTWANQLTEGGRLLACLHPDPSGNLVLLEKRGDTLIGRFTHYVSRFMPLRASVADQPEAEPDPPHSLASGGVERSSAVPEQPGEPWRICPIPGSGPPLQSQG